jgi:hypothetical protein|tara:strand:- start:57 stop:269 length:213 start_codon:yes stop_codon:yes gene_type:complete
MIKFCEIFYYTTILFFYSSSYAYSYIDISIIAVFFQMIFAGVIAALLTIKLWYKKLKELILLKYKKIFKK